MDAQGGALFEDGLLGQIRGRFCHVTSDPIVGPRVYLENAGGALTLRRVVEVVAEQTAIPDNAGRANATSRRIEKTIAEGRDALRILMGASSGVVDVGESTTSNAWTVLRPMIENVAGTNAVVTNLDHPATYDTVRTLCERRGLQWRVAGLTPSRGIVEPESVAAQVDDGTVVLTVIHSSNITGTQNAVADIIRAAREKKPDLYVLVDGAQHGPHGLVDVEALGCDGYLVSSYKMFSKIGSSAFYVSERVVELPHDKLRGKPATCWEQGTREQAGYAAWSEVLGYLCWLGGHFTEAKERRALVVAAMGAVAQHERALTRMMLHGTGAAPGLLSMPHVTVHGEVDDLSVKESCLGFSVDGMTSGEAVERLAVAGIRVHNRVSDAYSRHTLEALGLSECVRASLAHYNSPADVEAFLTATARMERH
ncbi:MAG: aminotransferase class V-fold PLP-dependent enzyme [Candidatus Brocadiaceae bacterium]|nr:aminotransferase class V-fold PLP-dependent enzyme [Candidatus Brocadiaceae bacterium]